MFTASRILYGLGLRGLAPRWVSYCTKSGVPVAALAVCVSGPDRRVRMALMDNIQSCFPWLAFMAVSSGSSKVFT